MAVKHFVYCHFQLVEQLFQMEGVIPNRGLVRTVEKLAPKVTLFISFSQMPRA